MKFSKVQVYLSRLLNARAPRFTITPAAGIPNNLFDIPVPDEIAPTVPQTQLATKHVFVMILLAQQKFTAALPVVEVLSTMKYELSSGGTYDKISSAVDINLLNGIDAISK